jgi:hypothetical protein
MELREKHVCWTARLLRASRTPNQTSRSLTNRIAVELPAGWGSRLPKQTSVAVVTVVPSFPFGTTTTANPPFSLSSLCASSPIWLLEWPSPRSHLEPPPPLSPCLYPSRLFSTSHRPHPRRCRRLGPRPHSNRSLHHLTPLRPAAGSARFPCAPTCPRACRRVALRWLERAGSGPATQRRGGKRKCSCWARGRRGVASS